MGRRSRVRAGHMSVLDEPERALASMCVSLELRKGMCFDLDDMDEMTSPSAERLCTTQDGGVGVVYRGRSGQGGNEAARRRGVLGWRAARARTCGVTASSAPVKTFCVPV